MKILGILTQSKEALAQKTAFRKARQLKRQQEALVDSLEAEKDGLQETIDSLLSVTTDKVKDNWNQKYQDALVQLKLIDVHIDIARNTLDELFTESVDDSEIVPG